MRELAAADTKLSQATVSIATLKLELFDVRGQLTQTTTTVTTLREQITRTQTELQVRSREADDLKKELAMAKDS